jgi:hypothetical protein
MNTELMIGVFHHHPGYVPDTPIEIDWFADLQKGIELSRCLFYINDDDDGEF